MLFLRTRVVACSLVVTLTMGIAPAARAQAGITLAEALARTLRDSPELATYAFQQRAAEADKLQAGLKPNPELGLTLENFAGTGEVRGTRSLETTLSLSQLIELGGKRRERVSAADTGLQRIAGDYEVARLDALAETARRYIDVVRAQDDIALAQLAIDLAKQTGEAVERRIRAGAASTAERNRARIASLRADLELQRSQGELDSRRVALAAMWGQSAPDFSGLSGDLHALPPLVDFNRFAAALEQSPDLMRYTQERRLREAEVRLAQAEAVPDLTFGAGIRRLEAGPDYGLVASLNLPLPFSNRNQGAIAAAQARVALTDSERTAALLRTRTVLYGLYQSAEQARRQAQALRGEALNEAEEALTLTQRGFANGRYSLIELADVQRQVLELRSQGLAASADAQRLDTEIERLTGLPIVAMSFTSGNSQ